MKRIGNGHECCWSLGTRTGRAESCWSLSAEETATERLFGRMPRSCRKSGAEWYVHVLPHFVFRVRREIALQMLTRFGRLLTT